MKHIYTKAKEHGAFDIWRGNDFGFVEHIALVTASTMQPMEREDIAKAICETLDAKGSAA